MRDRLIELVDKAKKEYASDVTDHTETEYIVESLLNNSVFVLPNGVLDVLCCAVDALADMVNQFGYSTTFRKQDAVCDGGLSALENAFSALHDCGYRMNSNGTINRKNLWNYSVKEGIEGLLKGGAE